MIVEDLCQLFLSHKSLLAYVNQKILGLGQQILMNSKYGGH